MRTLHIPVLPVFVFSALLTLVPGSRSYGAETSEDEAKAAMLANRANLEAFKAYQCRYTVTRATTDSVKSAMQGNLSNTRACEFVLVVDEVRFLFQSLAPAEIPRPPKPTGLDRNGKKSVSMDFLPFANLGKNGTRLKYFSPFHQADMTVPGDDRFDADMVHPTKIACIQGNRNGYPAKVFLEKAMEGLKITNQGLKELGGQNVLHVGVNGAGVDVELFFDVARGYLPMRVVLHRDRPYSVEKYDDVRCLLAAEHIEGKGWFPTKWVQVEVFADGKPCLVNQLLVTESEFVKAPKAEDFTLTLPAGTLIRRAQQDTTEESVKFRLQREEKVTPDDIERLNRMLDAFAIVPAGKEALIGTTINRRSPYAWAKWPLIVGGSILLVATALLYRRRNKVLIN
jgi:hypothetical protein